MEPLSIEGFIKGVTSKSSHRYRMRARLMIVYVSAGKRSCEIQTRGQRWWDRRTHTLPSKPLILKQIYLLLSVHKCYVLEMALSLLLPGSLTCLIHCISISLWNQHGRHPPPVISVECCVSLGMCIEWWVHSFPFVDITWQKQNISLSLVLFSGSILLKLFKKCWNEADGM